MPTQHDHEVRTRNTKVTLDTLNNTDSANFVAIAGPWFERSPWVAQRTYAKRPFADLDHLHQKLCETVFAASRNQQLKLISAHPDLVGRAALNGPLTPESSREQAAAGLGRLTSDELERFRKYNARYRDKFAFPFIICARENTKAAILAAFPKRLENSRDAEVQTALIEIGKIARLRMLDAVTED
jgi:OHCU decarboxylase